MAIEMNFSIDRANFSLRVDLNLPAQGVTAVFGPSGSGKTSLLRAMAGLEHHAGCSLTIGDVIWQSGNTFLPPHRRAVGYVFQEASLFTHLSVRHNLDYGFRRVPESERKLSLNDIIDLLGIKHLLKRKPATLSGGEKQRVAIARALAVSPNLLLMDEPLAALDVTSRHDLLPYLESVCRELEVPVIYVSHTMEEIVHLADHLVILDAGRVIATGPINDLLTQLDLSLVHSRDAAAVIKAVATGHDEKYDLTQLEFSGGCLEVTGTHLPIGEHVRVRLNARDISITLARQTDTSILNIFPATVDQMVAEGNAQVMVRLMTSNVPVLSRITQKSADMLALEPGKEVFVQVKSAVLLT